MRLSKLFLAFVPLAIIGCGGGGAGVGGGTTGGTVGSPAATVPVLATDDPNTDYDHVYVTIYSINLNPVSGSPVNIFTSTSGLQVDVRSLHDAQGGLFEFLDNAGVPAANYSGATVLLSKSVGVVRHGQFPTTNVQFPAANNAATSGESQFTFAFPKPFMPTPSTPIVLDFVLSNWTIDNGGTVHPVIAQGIDSGSGDGSRGLDRDVEGVITNLSGTAPGETFVLNYGDDHRSVQVSTDANTVIYMDNGAPNPTLINGEDIDATGHWQSGTFYAAQILIHGSNSGHHGHGEPHPVAAEGVASDLNEAAGTFTVTLDHAIDFVPTQVTTPVQVNSKTKLFYTNGVHLNQHDFFQDLKVAPTGTLVDMVADYDGTTLTGIWVIMTPPGQGLGGGPFHQILVAGDVNQVDQNAGTMHLVIRQWDNFEGADGQSAQVVTNSSTIYRTDLNIVTPAQWYAALNKKSLVAVLGKYDKGTLTATDISILSYSIGNGSGGQ